MTTTAAVKERPILFSGEMVRAILDGRKTQTRRVIKPQPDSGWMQWLINVNSGGDNRYFIDGECQMHLNTDREWNEDGECPYGKPGDRLYVRESCWMNDEKSWAAFAEEPNRYISKFEPGKIKHALIGHRESTPEEAEVGFREVPHVRKVPSIHVPKWACRLVLEVTDVRVERLQDITTDDIKAEGISLVGIPEWEREQWEDSYQAFWIKLWDQINGKRPGCAWDDNPWLWVVSFEQIPGDQ